MQLAKFADETGSSPRVGIVEGDALRPLVPGTRLADLLHAPDARAAALGAVAPGGAVPLGSVRLLAPIDAQEVWGAGVVTARPRRRPVRATPVGWARGGPTGCGRPPWARARARARDVR